MSYFSERTNGLANSFNPNFSRKDSLSFDALSFPVKQAIKMVRFAPLPPEPEDAHLTGGTRSLYRRLLGLNLRVHLAPALVLQPATKIA